MPSAVSVQKFRSSNTASFVNHIAAGSTSQPVGVSSATNYVDMADYGAFAAGICFTSGTGVTDFAIVAAVDDTGTNETVIVDSGTIALTTAGDYYWLEITAQQIQELAISTGYNLRYVTCYATSASSDTAVVAFILWMPRFPVQALTTNVTG